MMFIPKQTKYKKQQKGKNFNRITNVYNIDKFNLGSISLKSIDSGRLNSKQIASMRQAIQKIIKKSGRLIVNIFPATPISKKPVEVRMGKGKGNVDHWVFKVTSGIVLCEIETSNPVIGLKAMQAAQFRLPIKTKIILT
jgi:large subunit ribosomal protein L16